MIFGPESNMYYDRKGEPIDLDTWQRLWRDPEYKRVALFEVDGVRVSTVYLGLNHEWDDSRPPLIFETMIFGGKLDEEQWRYSTEQQAIDGHANAVRLVLAVDTA